MIPHRTDSRRTCRPCRSRSGQSAGSCRSARSRQSARYRRTREAGVSTAAVVGGVAALALVLVAGILIGRGSAGLRYDARPVVAQDAAPGTTSPLSQDAAADATAGTPGTAGPRERLPRTSDDTGGGPPPIVFDPVELDFGTVLPDTDMKGTFRITNVGDEPITIAGVKADCRCTAIDDIVGETIPPGGSLETSAMLEGPAASGAKRASVAVLVDGYAPAIMRLRARVGRVVEIDPTVIRPAPDVTSGRLVLTATDDRPFTIRASNGEPPTYLDGFTPGRDEPRASYAIGWDISQYDPQSCFDRNGNRMPVWWIIETDHPEAPIIDLQVRHVPCSMPEPLMARQWGLSKQRVILGALKPGEAADFSVDLKWLRHIEPNDTIREVRSESEHFDAELLGTTREGDQITCRVRITPREGYSGLFKGDARFFGHLAGQSQGLRIIGIVEDARTERAAR